VSFDDATGETHPSREAAAAHASNIARELAEDPETYRDYRVLVTDRDGSEVARVAIAEVLQKQS
jgi:hypothetical protein